MDMDVSARWMWCVFLLVLAGCVTYQDRPLSPATALDNFESRTLNSEPLALYLRENLKAAQEPPAWGLAEFTLAAFFYNPQLDVARAQWAVAKGRTTQAAERLNPTIGLAPGFNSTTGYAADISPWIVGAALDIPVETAGKRGYRVAEAQQLSEAARLHIAQTAWDIRRQVRRALLDLYAASRKGALLDRRRTLQADNVKLLEQLFQLGEISANEFSAARVLRNEADLACLDAERQQAQARADLAAAIGVPPAALESIQLSFDAFETLPADVPPQEVRSQALLHREDLLAALAEYQASQAALQQAIAGQYPDVQIGPGYEFDQGENKWSIGLAVTLPIFNQNQGAIATAEAQREEAAATFINLQARILAELEQAVTTCQASLKKLKSADAIAEQLAQTADRVGKMYAAGEILASDVNAAQLELNAANITRLEARTEALGAFGQLEDAMHVAADLPEGISQVSIQHGDQQEDYDSEE